MIEFINRPKGFFLLPDQNAGPDLFFELYDSDHKKTVYCAVQNKFQNPENQPSLKELAETLKKENYFGKTNPDLNRRINELLNETEVIPVVIAFPNKFRKDEKFGTSYLGRGSEFFTQEEEYTLQKAYGLLFSYFYCYDDLFSFFLFDIS